MTCHSQQCMYISLCISLCIGNKILSEICTKCLDRFVLFSTYLNPRPSQELITSGVDALHGVILMNIASRSVSSTTFPSRHDAFQYLFKDEGKASKYRGYILLQKKRL